MPDLVSAVVVAAGGSTRMAGADKILASLGGLPVLAHSLQVLLRIAEIGRIAVVLSERNLTQGRKVVESLVPGAKEMVICLGGARRQDSVRQGLAAVAGCRWVVVHDGARPLVTEELVLSGLREARSTGAAIAAVRVKDTVKMVESSSMIVSETLPREALWAVQTPQVFRYDLLMLAHQEAVGDVTDDASMIEQIGGKVKLYEGSYENLKLTTAEDLMVAEEIMRRRQCQ